MVGVYKKVKANEALVGTSWWAMCTACSTASSERWRRSTSIRREIGCSRSGTSSIAGHGRRDVVQFLEQPFVYAVRGNHEDELLQMHAESTRSPDSEAWLAGAEWWRDLSKAERRAVVARLEKLPLVIEVTHPAGNVAFLHADVPSGLTWSAFVAALKRDPDTAIRPRCCGVASAFPRG